MPIETDKDRFSITRMQCAIYQIYEDSWHVCNHYSIMIRTKIISFHVLYYVYELYNYI